MNLTKKQRQLLAWVANGGEPPQYAPGGLAVALARLRKLGLIKETHGVTPFGRQHLPAEDPMDWR